MRLENQLKQEMIKQNLAHCDVAEFIIGPDETITCFSSDDPVLLEETLALEIRLYTDYRDYLAEMLKSGQLIGRRGYKRTIE